MNGRCSCLTPRQDISFQCWEIGGFCWPGRSGSRNTRMCPSEGAPGVTCPHTRLLGRTLLPRDLPRQSRATLICVSLFLCLISRHTHTTTPTFSSALFHLGPSLTSSHKQVFVLGLHFCDSRIRYARSVFQHHTIFQKRNNQVTVKMHVKQAITAGMAMFGLTSALNPRADGLPPAVAARESNIRQAVALTRS
jgi:hypothetical protein